MQEYIDYEKLLWKHSPLNKKERAKFEAWQEAFGEDVFFINDMPRPGEQPDPEVIKREAQYKARLKEIESEEEIPPEEFRLPLEQAVADTAADLLAYLRLLEETAQIRLPNSAAMKKHSRKWVDEKLKDYPNDLGSYLYDKYHIFAPLIAEYRRFFDQTKAAFWPTAKAIYDTIDKYIAMQIKNDEIRIRLPMLPKQAWGIRSRYIYENFIQIKLSMENLYFPHGMLWTINFCHVYPADYPLIPVDVDNYEYKPIIDALAIHLGTTDGPDVFSYSATTKFTDKVTPGTHIQILPEKLDFTAFL